MVGVIMTPATLKLNNMSFSPSFSVSQSTANLALLTVTDTSTGSDGTITQRRIYLQEASGTYLVPTGTSTSYINYPLSGGASLTSSVLDKDYALNITVQWLDVSNDVLYTSTGLYCFNAYGESYLYQLTQYQTSNPSLVSNSTFYLNKMKLRTFMDDAVQAVSSFGDIYSAQSALSDGYFLINNPTTFF